jgi:hypothetical protein
VVVLAVCTGATDDCKSRRSIGVRTRSLCFNSSKVTRVSLLFVIEASCKIVRLIIALSYRAAICKLLMTSPCIMIVICRRRSRAITVWRTNISFQSQTRTSGFVRLTVTDANGITKLAHVLSISTAYLLLSRNQRILQLFLLEFLLRLASFAAFGFHVFQ